MAVYTPLERDEIEVFTRHYGLGPLLDFEGVAEGIENTNYFVSTDESARVSENRTEPVHHYVLTVFETLSTEQLQFYVDFTTLLNLRGLPVPCPLTDADGQAVKLIHQKPALLIPRIGGQHPDQPSLEQCQAIGSALAELHQCSVSSAMQHRADRDYAWIARTGQQLLAKLAAGDQQLMTEELANLEGIAQQTELPTAVIHGDLFRDNCLFDGERLTALIDFYSAGNGHLLLDLAVVVNDWCIDEQGQFDQARQDAIVSSYHRGRPLLASEQQLWPHFLRLAALRFWVSRLLAHQTYKAGGLTEQKDPGQYRTILLNHRSNPKTLSL
jgi:homoserine kinase type II